MKKVYYRKLIRDSVPEIIARKDGRVLIRTLSARDTFRALLRKVGEEASALPRVKSKKELVAELADVIDVIEEIMRVKRIPRAVLKEAQRKNAKRKGGFKKRLFLVWSSDVGYRTNEKKGKP